jgi:hypothetical protein
MINPSYDYFITKIPVGIYPQLPISADRYNEIRSARNVRLHALYLEQKYDFLVENFVEFEDALLKESLREMTMQRYDFSDYSVTRGHFNRRIMNLLSTGRTYEDSVPQHINSIFKRDPTALSRSKAALSKQYDSRLNYRAMCKLRNFIQHQGLPVSGSFYHEKWVHLEEDANPKSRHTVDPYLSLNELEDGDFNKNILSELKNTGDKLDLKKAVREYVEGISSAHLEIRVLILENITHADKVLKEAVDCYLKVWSGQTEIGLIAVELEDFSKIDKNFYENPVYIINNTDHYKNLLKKNVGLSNLVLRYVSSEARSEDFN